MNENQSLESVTEDQEIYLTKIDGFWAMDAPHQQILADYKRVISPIESIQEACQEECEGFAIHYQYQPGGGDIFCTLYELVLLGDNQRKYRPFASNVKVDHIEEYVEGEMKRREEAKKSFFPTANDNNLNTFS